MDIPVPKPKSIKWRKTTLKGGGQGTYFTPCSKPGTWFNLIISSSERRLSVRLACRVSRMWWIRTVLSRSKLNQDEDERGPMLACVADGALRHTIGCQHSVQAKLYAVHVVQRVKHTEDVHTSLRVMPALWARHTHLGSPVKQKGHAQTNMDALCKAAYISFPNLSTLFRFITLRASITKALTTLSG